jgi:hypothetical protein
MTFHDLELEYDIFDADTAEAYEQAARQVGQDAAKVAGEGLADNIRRQCKAVFTFFDTLFGEGFHRELFGERTNLMECLSAFREFTKLINEQRGALDALVAEVNEERAAPNRATRRAIARANKS